MDLAGRKDAWRRPEIGSRARCREFDRVRRGNRVTHTFRERRRWSIERAMHDAAGTRTLTQERALDEDVPPVAPARAAPESTADMPARDLLALLLGLAIARILKPERYK